MKSQNGLCSKWCVHYYSGYHVEPLNNACYVVYATLRFINDNILEYQEIKENGKTKFIVLPVKLIKAILYRLDDESDLQAITESYKEPLYDQDEAEEYIFMNAVRRERLERGWTQKDLAERICFIV